MTSVYFDAMPLFESGTVHCDHCVSSDSVARGARGKRGTVFLHLFLHALLTVSLPLALALRFFPSRGDAWRTWTIPCCQKRPYVWPGKWQDPELHGQHRSW